MVVILGNRGVRPCQTLTILLHQSAARLGTRARRSGLDLRCDLSTFGQFGPRLQVEGRVRDLAMFNLAIDSKLRGCDIVALKVEDIAPNGYAIDRATVRQKKTGRPVKFELTDQTRQAVDDYLKTAGKKSGDFLFTGRRDDGRCITTRQYARLVSEWIANVGLDSKLFGTHSLRRTKATLIYRRTGNLRAVQLLLGHTKIESTVRYLGIEVDDALSIAEQVDV
jgi:integrase